MKWSMAMALAAVLLVGSQSTAADDKPSPAKQLQLNLRVLEGDPLGSREAGTLKVVADPRILTLENRPASFVSGGEIAVTDGDGMQLIQLGRMVEVKPGAVKDSKVRLDITLSNTTIAERTEERIQVHTESTRMISTVRLGEVVKFRWRKGSADRRVWVELTVEEVKP